MDVLTRTRRLHFVHDLEEYKCRVTLEPLQMSDLLLTHGYFLFEDEKEAQIMRPYPTLGLLYISAYLRRDGIDVEIFDSTFQSRQELLHRLARDRGVIGIYTNLMTRKPVLDIVAAAKRYGWTVIL